MFHLESNASNLALLHLIDHLAERGLDWMDIQVLSPHLESLGSRPVFRIGGICDNAGPGATESISHSEDQGKGVVAVWYWGGSEGPEDR